MANEINNLDKVLEGYNLTKKSIKAIDNILPKEKDVVRTLNQIKKKDIADTKEFAERKKLYDLFENYSRADSCETFEFDKEVLIKDLAAQKYTLADRTNTQFLRGVQYAIDFLLDY